jgi:pimeloyl-ACP methyl ester carboxylesterase
MASPVVQQQAATVWQGRVPLRVHVKGAGPAVVFFHGPWGLTWGPFLDALAERFTVYAPEHPGTAPGEPDAIREVDSLWDLILCYDELLEQSVAGALGDAERFEVEMLRREADRFMLIKAHAAVLLRWRGHDVPIR